MNRKTAERSGLVRPHEHECSPRETGLVACYGTNRNRRGILPRGIPAAALRGARVTDHRGPAGAGSRGRNGRTAGRAFSQASGAGGSRRPGAAACVQRRRRTIGGSDRGIGGCDDTRPRTHRDAAAGRGADQRAASTAEGRAGTVPGFSAAVECAVRPLSARQRGEAAARRHAAGGEVRPKRGRLAARRRGAGTLQRGSREA